MNPSKQATSPEHDQMVLEKISDIVCLIFNELDNVPYKTRINFLSLLVSGIIEQSLNERLVRSYDPNSCDIARKQIDLCIKRINEAFSDIMKVVPQNKHKIVKYYYNQYLENFNIYKKALNAQNSCPRYNEFYAPLLENLYAPRKDERDYFVWLTNETLAYSFSRVNPILNWPVYDSDFERFVGYLLNTRYDRGFPIIKNEQVKKLFNNLRKKHGDKFIINYYETIVFLCMYEDREHIEKLLQKQKELNIYDKDLTLRQIEAFNERKDREDLWK